MRPEWAMEAGEERGQGSAGIDHVTGISVTAPLTSGLVPLLQCLSFGAYRLCLN